jgi:hypothetical protein
MSDDINLKSKIDSLERLIMTLNGEMILLRGRVDELEDQLDSVYIKSNIVSHEPGTI